MESRNPSTMHLVLAGAAIALLMAGLAILIAPRALAGNAAQRRPPAEGVPSATAVAPMQNSESQWYSTQLHIHGWSNHNAGSQPGSMQYHTVWAQEKNLDVIWWSDHNKMFVQAMDLPLYLEAATITDSLDIAIPHPPWIDPRLRGWQIGWLDANRTGSGTPSVALNYGVLRMELQSPDNQFASFSYRALSYLQRRVPGHSFGRPLISDPIVNFDVSRCGSSGADDYAEIRFGLSWHTADALSAPQGIVYRLTPADEPSTAVVTPLSVTYSLPVSTTHITRSLLSDASLLPDGDDNAIQELNFEIGSRSSSTACLEISNFYISSDHQDPAVNYAAQRPVAQRLESAYDVAERVGWEQNAGSWHLNPYLPEEVDLVPGWEDLNPPSFVPMVHKLGGIVALNHPFGADYGPLLPDDQQEALVQARLDTLVPARAWGIDLLEIYLNRAQVDLSRHLKLWDLLAANDVPLCGLAASDQHGGPLTSPGTHMVTWINGPDFSQNSLFAGLAQCRAFFGRLDLFDGVIDLKLGSIVMGGMHPTEAGTGLLQVVVDPMPDGAEVRLVQVEDQPGNQLSYIVDHEPIDPNQLVAIDMRRPGFVRVELWSSGGVPIAFSNRIYLKDLSCDVNKDFLVSVADVQTVAGAFNLSAPPASPAYDLRPDGIIDVRDIVLATQCWLAQS